MFYLTSRKVTRDQIFQSEQAHITIQSSVVVVNFLYYIRMHMDGISHTYILQFLSQVLTLVCRFSVPSRQVIHTNSGTSQIIR